MVKGWSAYMSIKKCQIRKKQMRTWLTKWARKLIPEMSWCMSKRPVKQH